MKLKQILKIVWAPVVAASLCCLSPIFVLLLGFGTLSFATSLSDTLYGDYKWVFRIIGFILLAASVFYYFYKVKGVCTLDQAKRHRNEIINTIVLALIGGVLGYIFFLYVVVHYIGVWYGIWADY